MSQPAWGSKVSCASHTSNCRVSVDYTLQMNERGLICNHCFHPQFSVRCAGSIYGCCTIRFSHRQSSELPNTTLLLWVALFAIFWEKLYTWTALFSTYERKQCQSNGKDITRDLMALLIGAPLYPLSYSLLSLSPECTCQLHTNAAVSHARLFGRWLYLSTVHQRGLYPTHACLVGPNEEL